MNKLISSTIQPLLFILIGVLARILPHPANFTPITAIALFGGAYLTKRQSYVIPVLIMFLSDLVIGFDSYNMRISVYGSILIGVLLGSWVKKNKSSLTIIKASLIASTIFFIITNFTVWAFGTMYTKNITGLINAYLYAIPFFKNTLLGDLFYSGIFFGGYELVMNLKAKFCSQLAN